MTPPTDEELEAMAVKLWKGSVFQNKPEAEISLEAAAMLRACKGRAKPEYQRAIARAMEALLDSPKGVVPQEAEPFYNSTRGDFSALEPAPDARQEAWRAGIEAGIVELRTYAPHQDGTGPEHDIGYAAGYHTALNRLRALAEKGPTDDLQNA